MDQRLPEPAVTDWRALCAELVEAVDTYDATGEDLTAALDRARAALAAEADGPAVPEGREPASVVGEPSDEELDVLADEWLDWNLEGHRAFARAALARYGHQPAPPAAGEVGELVAFLRDWGDDYADEGTEWHRAADLLEQRHPAPVPVSERLPGPGDCDAEGRCWVHQPHEACPESPAWELMQAKYASTNYGAACWLPATALPLPAGEVE